MITITLDGAQLTVDPTRTLLQIAKQHQIDIPSLCGDNTSGPKTPCDLCVVEIAGLGIRRACETPPEAGMVITSQSDALRAHRQQALGRILADHYADCEAPCQRACPAGVDIQSYLHHIAMGGDWRHQHPQEITAEICRVTPQYAGILWDKVGAQGLQWPCNDAAPEGTRLLHGKQFTRGKGEMVATPFRYAAELPDETYPIVLTTGRLLEQFHTGTMTRKTRGLDKLAGPRVMMSVADAERMGISNSERVKVTSRRGHIELPAFVTKRMQPGVVFIPFHFAEAPANRLTINATDPHAKIPEFKVAAVRIDKLESSSQAGELSMQKEPTKPDIEVA